jgi:hypothetical protein
LAGVIFKFLTLNFKLLSTPHHQIPPYKMDGVGKKNWLIKVGVHKLNDIIAKKSKKTT